MLKVKYFWNNKSHGTYFNHKAIWKSFWMLSSSIIFLTIARRFLIRSASDQVFHRKCRTACDSRHARKEVSSCLLGGSFHVRVIPSTGHPSSWRQVAKICRFAELSGRFELHWWVQWTWPLPDIDLGARSCSSWLCVPVLQASWHRQDSAQQAQALQVGWLLGSCFLNRTLANRERKRQGSLNYFYRDQCWWNSHRFKSWTRPS